ncbi:hypothetical protein [Deinococcus sp. Arct2-2]|uniref:hypothetical protein n=1 Tax=Deinococcus sp. Arct2-2 TaxID=2568653 RepID=UPI001454C94A|nr:hypothetical protein [Deinococcus sp. Arct2-2]
MHEGLDSEIVIATTADGRSFFVKDWKFRPLAGFTDVHRMTAAGKLGYIVKTDGTLYSFSLDRNNNPSVPVQVKGMSGIVDVSMSGGHVLALRRDGTLFAQGSNDFGQLGNGTM